MHPPARNSVETSVAGDIQGHSPFTSPTPKTPRNAKRPNPDHVRIWALIFAFWPWMAQVAEEGLEPRSATSRSAKGLRQTPKSSGAESGALSENELKLTEISKALPHLPPAAIEILLQTVRAFRT